MSLSDETALAAIAERVSKGECILFLGAGVHYPPPEGSLFTYPEQYRPPLGRALGDHLAAACHFNDKFPKDTSNNLQRIALYFETEFGRRELVDQVRNAVMTGKKPSP